MSVRRRKRVPIMIPLASMGDIAFLLIIFFMLTSNFIREAHVKLRPASSANITTLKPGTVTVSVDRNGEVWLQGQLCSVEGLEHEVFALLKGRDSRVVVLKVDKDLPQKRYGPVLMALSKADAEIALMGTKIEK